jgi:hypothetical protein
VNGAEHDPLTSEVIVADGYQIKDGLASTTDLPGFGLTIDEPGFGRDADIRFDVGA